MVPLQNSYAAKAFQRLIDRENDGIERKTGAGLNALQDAFVAFSNTDGGTIFIGVTDDGTVAGRRLDQGLDDKINEAALNARDVGRYRIQEIDVAGTPVVAVEVQRRVEGFSQTSSGRVLVRRGPRNVALFGADLTRFINERALQRFEHTDTGLESSETRDDLLDELCQAFEWTRTSADLSDRLAEQGLLTPNGHLTIAGVLFLTDPATSIRRTKAVIEVRRFPEGAQEYDRREEFGGPIHHQVVGATRFIADEIGEDLVVTGLYRHELPRLPEVVIREAISNAVAHRSYEDQGTAIVAELHPDRVVITSPGGLPEPVTVENMRHAQSARNADVIDVLRRYRLAEDAGRGVDVMQDTMRQELLDPPEFEDVGHAVRVTLPLRGSITPRERAWITDLERRGKIGAMDRLLLVHAARGETLTNARAREILSVAHMEARAALQRLRDAELLEQHGTRGGASYTLVDELAPPAAYRMSAKELEDLVLTEARNHPINNERVRQLTGLERRAALSLLQRMVDAKKLRRIGSRRGTRYRALGKA